MATILKWEDVDLLCNSIAEAMSHYSMYIEKLSEPIRLYGIPRGGIYVALALQKAICKKYNRTVIVTSDIEEADFIIDDIVDSGKTKAKYRELTEHRLPFFALIEKQKGDNSWYVFPWETANKETGPQSNIARIIEFIGEDIDRDGLKETPDRVVKSYETLYSGYAIKEKDVKDILKSFEDTSDEMVVLKNVEFYSTCEHHMLPFFGKAHIAYIPNGRVVGISKLARLLEVYSRRLQIQERICQQITTAITKYLRIQSAACILEAQHFCMTSRGVQKQGSMMVTSSLTGAFVNTPVRAELFNLIGK